MTEEPRDELEETMDMDVPEDPEEDPEGMDRAAEADETLPPGSMPPSESDDPE